MLAIGYLNSWQTQNPMSVQADGKPSSAFVRGRPAEHEHSIFEMESVTKERKNRAHERYRSRLASSSFLVNTVSEPSLLTTAPSSTTAAQSSRSQKPGAGER